MYVLIRYSAGAIVEGVVLANKKNRIRVAVAGFQDTLEFKRSAGQWIGAGRETIELEFMMAGKSIAGPHSMPIPARMVATIAASN